MNVPEKFPVVAFTGGLHAATADIDPKTDREAPKAEVDEFLTANGFTWDSSRLELGTIITPPLAGRIMCHEQMIHHFPVKAREQPRPRHTVCRGEIPALVLRTVKKRAA